VTVGTLKILEVNLERNRWRALSVFRTPVMFRFKLYQFYGAESSHPPEHPLKPAVLMDTLTFCSRMCVHRCVQ